MARHDDERERERAAILRRRGQLMACAMVAGVGLPHCEPSYCLSVAVPDGGGMPAHGGTPTHAGDANSGEGGQAFCLTIAEPGGAPAGAGAPSAGAPSAAGGEGGGGPTVCLSVK
jgi:hypothetical protein